VERSADPRVERAKLQSLPHEGSLADQADRNSRRQSARRRNIQTLSDERRNRAEP